MEPAITGILGRETGTDVTGTNTMDVTALIANVGNVNSLNEIYPIKGSEEVAEVADLGTIPLPPMMNRIW